MYTDCVQAIEELLERAKAAGLPPIMSAYTSLIKAWAKQGSTVEVRRSLAHMVEDGVQPNALHYSAAITAHTQCGRPQEAEASIVHLAIDVLYCQLGRDCQHLHVRRAWATAGCVTVIHPLTCCVQWPGQGRLSQNE